MKPHSERWSTVWYVCGEYERADEPDRQLLEDMGFKWPTAGLLQMAIWEEMKEYGVDQNTINYNSFLSKSKEPRRNGGTRMRTKSWTLSMWMSSLALLGTASVQQTWSNLSVCR